MVNGYLLYVPKWRPVSMHLAFTIYHLREDLHYPFNRSRQHVHFFFRVIESKRSSRGRRHVEALHHRLRTMMSGAYGDAFLIENGANVVWMNFINHKRQHT